MNAYVCTKAREAQIRKGIPRLKLGMTPTAVLAILGRPDKEMEWRGPVILFERGSLEGTLYTYWIRWHKHGESDYVFVKFGFDEQVHEIVWNIDGQRFSKTAPHRLYNPRQ